MTRKEPSAGPMNRDQLIMISRARKLLASGRARQIRRKARLSSEELAQAVGVARGTLSRWENGQSQPRGLYALRYAELLEELERGGRTAA